MGGREKFLHKSMFPEEEKAKKEEENVNGLRGSYLVTVCLAACELGHCHIPFIRFPLKMEQELHHPEMTWLKVCQSLLQINYASAKEKVNE